MIKYSDLPVNLIYINYFSCEFLFCSELLDLKQMVDSSLFYSILEQKFENSTLRKFLTESPKITPFGTMWYYGREWFEISEYYYQHLEQIRIFEEELSSPYYPNLKIIV